MDNQGECVYTLILALIISKKALNYNYDTDKNIIKDIKPDNYITLYEYLDVKNAYKKNI